MKITSIKQQVKNPGRVSVFVDGRYSFSLSLDELLTSKIKSGQEIDSAEVKKFKKISADGKLRARSLEWLLNRPHSERELRDYLYRKKAEPEQIENFISEFSDRKYLDNTKFAEWFAELQIRHGKSNRQIKSELYKKGIGRETVEKVLKEQGSDEKVRLKAVISKKSKSARYKNNSLKLKQYLTSQGFSYNLINEVLKDT